MTDHETHLAGTDDLVKRLRNAAGIDQMEYPYPMCDEAADRIEQLETALTRANAATAAAYEVAARRVEREGHSLGDEIRALATPDQTAALDKLIAEAEAQAVEKTAAMVRTWRNTTPMTGEECADAILADSKKGGV